MNTISSIINNTLLQINEPINILTCPTHERYESNFAKNNLQIYSITKEGIKNWCNNYAKRPNNYYIIENFHNIKQLPQGKHFHIALSQNKFGQFQLLQPIAKQLHIPLVSLEHTLPMPHYNKEILNQIKNMRGDTNIFISEFSQKKWGWSDKESTVIHHGVDTNTFCNLNLERKSEILTVVNDYINRDWCCGYSIYQEATQNLPTRPVGDTPGLSNPTKTIDELINHYNTSQVFLNTATHSPIASVVLEAMACETCVVSLKSCMVPEIITHGVNGFLGETPQELRYWLEYCLKNPDICQATGKKARETVLAKFSLENFLTNWYNILYQTIKDHS